MKKILVALFSISIVFSGTITYWKAINSGAGTFSSFSNENSDGKVVAIIENVRIDKVTKEGVTYIEEKVTSSNLGGGGMFISLAGILNLITYNRLELDLELKSDNIRTITNVSLGSLLLGGFLIATNEMNFSHDKKGIPCEDIIEIKDAKGRLIEFNCKNID